MNDYAAAGKRHSPYVLLGGDGKALTQFEDLQGSFVVAPQLLNQSPIFIIQNAVLKLRNIYSADCGPLRSSYGNGR